MRAPVRIGLQIPRFDFPGVGPEALFEKLVEIASTAEASGFDSVFVMDHLHQIPGVGPPTERMLEGNTILAAIAARTTRLNIGLMVGSVTYRNPALHAKITTTIDVISGGRAIHSLGAGWFEDEHRAYGYDFPPLKERFERLEDALHISRAMFTQEAPSYEGRHYRVEGVLNNPRPLRGDIPILVGGSGERKTLRLVAQYADACNVFGDAGPGPAPDGRARRALRRRRARPGGDHPDQPADDRDRRDARGGREAACILARPVEARPRAPPEHPLARRRPTRSPRASARSSMPASRGSSSACRIRTTPRRSRLPAKQSHARSTASPPLVTRARQPFCDKLQ